MQVLGRIMESAFILIIREHCQGFVSSQRQEQVDVFTGPAVDSRGHTGGGGEASEDRCSETLAVIHASDGGILDQGGDIKQAEDLK